MDSIVNDFKSYVVLRDFVARLLAAGISKGMLRAIWNETVRSLEERNQQSNSDKLELKIRKAVNDMGEESPDVFEVLTRPGTQSTGPG